MNLPVLLPLQQPSAAIGSSVKGRPVDYSPIPAMLSCGLILCRFCVGDPSCREFLSTVALSGPEGVVSQRVSTMSA